MYIFYHYPILTSEDSICFLYCVRGTVWVSGQIWNSHVEAAQVTPVLVSTIMKSLSLFPMRCNIDTMKKWNFFIGSFDW